MTSDAPTAVRVLRNMDLAVLAIALPIFLVADINVLGWVTGAGLYVAQRLVRAWAERRAKRAEDPRTTVGVLAGSMLARGWIVSGTILAVGLTTESEVGLSSAVLFLATFTVAFTMALATGGPRGAASAVSAAPLPPERPRK
jgi:Na+-driven multidrug efflux pump